VLVINPTEAPCGKAREGSRRLLEGIAPGDFPPFAPPFPCR